MVLRVNSVEELGGRLRQARAAAILTQTELALLLGVSARTVQGWEAGRLPLQRHLRRVVAFIAEHLEEAA